MTLYDFLQLAESNPDLVEPISEQFKKIKPPTRIGEYEIKELNQIKYGEVMELRQKLPQKTTDIEIIETIATLMISPQIKVLHCEVYELMPYVEQILKFLVDSAKTEQKRLKYTPTKDEKKAKIDDLAVFGEWGTIDTIAQRMHILHDDVLNLRYNDVISMLWKDLEEAKYQRRLIKIMNKE